MKPIHASLAELGEFDEIIDVRSPAEFADDHIPGASNCPVLDNEQRARIGTLYVQVSPFEARKVGAALVAANIARHLEQRFLDRPRTWRPLIYCWRGGQRSGAMVTIFRAIGWNAAQLEGGYRTYRRNVVAELVDLPARFSFHVLSGPTGSGKTSVLHALAALGEQVLDLEALACHKGSVLGVLPETPQPSQKAFESSIAYVLRGFDPARPVYVEAESRKIGKLRVTDELLAGIRAGHCFEIDAPLPARVDYLLTDYAYFLAQPEWLKQRLDSLRELHSKETLANWHRLIDAGEWRQLVHELLSQHYDPHYRRSQGKHYGNALPPTSLTTVGFSKETISGLCGEILRLSVSSMGKESCP